MGRDQLGDSVLHTEPQDKPQDKPQDNGDKALSSGTLDSPCQTHPDYTGQESPGAQARGLPYIANLSQGQKMSNAKGTKVWIFIWASPQNNGSPGRK